MGRRTEAEVRSWSAEAGVLMGFGWSHFLEARGLWRQLGRMAEGSRSPPKPALIRPPPLSRTTTWVLVDMFVSFSSKLLKISK